MSKSASGWRTVGALLRLVGPLTPALLLTVLLGWAGFMALWALMLSACMGVLWLLGEAPPWSPSLAGVFGLLAGCALLRGVLRYGEQLGGHYVAFKLLALLRNHIFDALRRQAFQKLNRHDAGQLVSVITTDVELIEVFYAHTIAPILIALLSALTFSVFLAQIAWPLAVLALLVYTALAYWLPRRLARGKQALSREYRAQMGALSAFFLDTVRGMREVVVFGLRDTRLQALEQHSRQLDASFRRAKGHEAAVRGYTEALLAGGNLLMLALALYLLAVGKIGFGGALAAVITLLASYGPFVALSNLSAGLPQTLAAAERVLALLAEPAAVEEVRNQTDLSEVKTLEANGVGFDYERQAVLHDVSFHAHRGEIIGIHGASGSGKSTLLQLLLRAFDPHNGSIRLNGCDLRHINTNSLRQHMVYLSQHTYLFHCSVYENIVMARRGASRDEVEAAAKMANIHERIMALPQGYDTMVPEHGGLFSDGEKQRLSLARAFLHDASVWLLDEPTSNLDSLNEAMILQTLLRLKADKIVILVSHRLSTLGICDRVLHLQQGHISPRQADKGCQ